MQISQCKLLVFLDLAETGISGKIPYNLGELKNLKTLTLQISLVSFHVKLVIARPWRNYLFAKTIFLERFRMN
ncbi:hypothetical protein ACSBR2_001164 [Camellia fascicularis]